MNKCRCCSKTLSDELFSAKVLKKKVKYFSCDYCGYVQTETPLWLEEAYTSKINKSDTGIMSRNLSNISIVLSTLILIKNRNSIVVDYAGGFGFLVRLLRDIGVNAFWSDRYCDNLVARGFEYENKNEANLVTAFECFEHFVKPKKEMVKLLEIAPNILLTTNIIANPAPKPSDWWYYGLEHGQHIGFYRLRTLQFLADKFGLYLISDGNSRHFFSKKKYSYQTWRVLIYIANKFPNLLSIGLKSKTWNDHLINSKKNKNNLTK